MGPGASAIEVNGGGAMTEVPACCVSEVEDKSGLRSESESDSFPECAFAIEGDTGGKLGFCHIYQKRNVQGNGFDSGISLRPLESNCKTFAVADRELRVKS
jgi:hypothetical protein